MVGAGERTSSHGRGSILVFENEPILLDLLSLVLTREGYIVTATPRSDEAVGLATTRHFDLAIADLGLRRRDGCDLVHRLRQLSPAIPIVATTAYPAGDIVSFAEENTELLLPKPFGIGELLVAVEDTLQARLGGERKAESPLSSPGRLSAASSVA